MNLNTRAIPMTVVAASLIMAFAALQPELSPLGDASPTAVAAPGPGGKADAVVLVGPYRYADTRPGQSTFDGQYAGEGRLADGARYRIQIAGRGDVPVAAAGVVVNVTAVAPDGPGYLLVDRCTNPRPVASSVNYVADVTVPNEVVSRLSTDGSLCVFTLRAADVLVDVVGYLPA